MAERSLYLVCYDIRDTRRLRRVHKFLLGYKVGGQKSFFECWFTPAELRHVRETLNEITNPAEDRVHLFYLGAGQKSAYFGRAHFVPVGQAFIIA